MIGWLYLCILKKVTQKLGTYTTIYEIGRNFRKGSTSQNTPIWGIVCLVGQKRVKNRMSFMDGINNILFTHYLMFASKKINSLLIQLNSLYGLSIFTIESNKGQTTQYQSQLIIYTLDLCCLSNHLL